MSSSDLGAATAPHSPTPAPEPSPRRKRVLLLFGGRSGEHAISCATAAGVLRVLDRERYEVIPVGITRDGHWVLVRDEPGRWVIREGHLPEVTAGEGGEVILPMGANQEYLRVIEDAPEDDDGALGGDGVSNPDSPQRHRGGIGGATRSLGHIDVVLPLLHGPFGEDGTVQGMLEMADMRYVGSGVLASAVGMDKHFMKRVLQAEGLPVGPFTTILPGQWERDPQAVVEEVARLGLPLFVKPARAGSSLGITRITSLDELAAALATAWEQDPKVVVEAAITGREIECAVLGGRAGASPRASLPGEITVSGTEHTFYDFESKYLGEGDVRLSCPAELPAAVSEEVRALAVRTFEAVGAEGLARVDVFVQDNGSVVINEINTMPGFTPFSMYPQMWEATGLSYGDLLDELLAIALERPLGLR